MEGKSRQNTENKQTFDLTEKFEIVIAFLSQRNFIVLFAQPLSY